MLVENIVFYNVYERFFFVFTGQNFLQFVTFVLGEYNDRWILSNFTGKDLN